MSSINAPQWFKDALQDWPTAVWLPLPDLIGNKQTGDLGYASPATLKSNVFTTSDEIAIFKTRPDVPPGAEQFQYPNQRFMPFEKGIWNGVRRFHLLNKISEQSAMRNGAIIIMGYGMIVRSEIHWMRITTGLALALHGRVI